MSKFEKADIYLDLHFANHIHFQSPEIIVDRSRKTQLPVTENLIEQPSALVASVISDLWWWW